MAYKKINQPKISDVIMGQLEQMILEGSLQPGQKLPPERELALQFEVSRPSLREAIQKLEAKGCCCAAKAVALMSKSSFGRAWPTPSLN